MINAPSYIFYILHFLNPLFIYLLFQNLYLPVAVSAVWEIAEYFILQGVGHYSILFLEVEKVEFEPLYDVLVIDIGAAVFATALGDALVRFRRIPKVPRNKWFVALAWLAFRALLTSPVSAIGWECPTPLSFICEERSLFLPWGALIILVIDSLYAWLTWKDFYVVVCVCLICATAFVGKLTSAPLVAFGLTAALALVFFVSAR